MHSKALIALTLSITCADLLAQSLEEVIVTSQRRAQSLQDVPMAVSAFNAEALKESNMSYVTDLMAYTPGLTGARQGVGVTQFAVRGISSNSFGVGGDNSVGIFVDDIYAGRATIAGLPFIDTERVEVLKGPQGSLFGRNTSAGAISITSNKPNNGTSLNLNVDIAEHDSMRTVITGNTALIDDVLLLRGSYIYEESEGFMSNPILGRDFGNQISAGKLSLLWQTSDTVQTLLSVNMQEVQEDGRTFEPLDNASPFLLLSGINNGDVFDEHVNHGSRSDETNDVLSASLRIDWDLDDNMRLSAISSMTNYNNNARFDADGTPLRVLESIWPREESESLGQEFRLTGHSDNMNWLLGASYFKEAINGEQINRYQEDIWLQILVAQGLASATIPADALGVPHPSFTLCDGRGVDTLILGASCADRDEHDLSIGKFENYAVYGDISVSISDALILNAGLRYSHDNKNWRYRSELSAGLFTTLGLPAFILTDITGAQGSKQSDSWSKLTPRLAINYHLNDEFMLYVSGAQGYKAGGFSAANQFDEEATWSYEAGIKSSFWDGRAQLNAALYHYDYDNLQVQVIRNSVLRVVNVPDMQGRGAEIDLKLRLNDAFDITTAIALNDSEIGEFETDTGNLHGNSPAYAPKKSASIIVRYIVDNLATADIIVRGETSYQSKQYFSIFNTDGEAQGGYTQHHARIALVDKNQRWELAFFGRNLSNKNYLVNAYGLTETVIQRGLPRQMGLQLSINFD